MPTIEIVSVNKKKKLKIPKGKYPFWVRQDLELLSHRGLFQQYLDKTQGVILHLGNLDFKNHSPWFFGDELIDWDFEPVDEERFRFLPNHFLGIRNLLFRAWLSSPVNESYFLTDIQRTIHIYEDNAEITDLPIETTKIKPDYSLVRLIEEHDSIGLEWNTLYKIK